MSPNPPSQLPETPTNITRVNQPPYDDNEPPMRGPWYIAVLVGGGVFFCIFLCVMALLFRASLQDLFSDDGDEDENTPISLNQPTSQSSSQPPSALPTFGGDSPSVSVSGDLVFVSNRTGQWEIYRMNLDGSSVTALTANSPDLNYAPDWSPDGTQIVYEARRDGNWDIYVMNADGGNQRRLTTDPAIDRAPAWSPDGQFIAFSSDRRGNYDVYVMSADSTNIRSITGSFATEYAPDWSPDGQSLVYQSDRTGILQIYRQQINQDDTLALQLTSDAVSKGGAAWNPDGSTIAYYTNVGRDAGLDIYMVSANGGTAIPLVVAASNEAVPSWSWDGRSVYFHQGSFGGTNLVRLEIATGAQQNITERADRNWSPDLRPGGVSEIIAEVPTQMPALPQPTAILAGSCPNNAPSRIRLNERVRGLENMTNFLQLQPSTSSGTVAQVTPGLVMRVLEGPQCAQGYTWWRVQYGRVSGWVIEVYNTEYWLESVEFNLLIFYPPADRSRPPENARILEGGLGLTDGRGLPPGEFQVEWYCNLQQYGVQTDEINWFCTLNNAPVFILDINDFDSICQASYYNPLAFAIQDRPNAAPAYRWRCYEYTSAPTPK